MAVRGLYGSVDRLSSEVIDVRCDLYRQLATRPTQRVSRLLPPTSDLREAV
jgi:hypothetical protein